MQIALRTAVLKAMEDSPFYNDLLAFIKTIPTTDLYQGSRILAYISKKMHDFLLTKRAELFTAGQQISQMIRDHSDVAATQVHFHLTQLDKYINLFTMSGYPHAEQQLVTLVGITVVSARFSSIATLGSNLLEGDDRSMDALFRALPIELSLAAGSLPLSRDDTIKDTYKTKHHTTPQCTHSGRLEAF